MTVGTRRSAHAVARRLRVLEELRRTTDPASLLKARAAARAELRRDGRDAEVRLALAEHYRACGVRSQAGRWGITTDGWATQDEIRQLRHWLLGYADRSDFARDMLRLDADEALPDAVLDLVEPSLREPRDAPRSRGQTGCWSFLVAFVSMIVATVCGGILIVKAFNDDPDLFSAAHTLRAIGGTAGAIAIAAFLIGRWLDRRDMRRTLEYPSTQALDPSFAVGLAWRLTDAGDRRAGEILLRARLRRADDREARRALVASAREEGRADQAGRWGAPLDGETTVAERQAFAASLGGVEPGRRLERVRELSEAWLHTSRDMRDVVRRAEGSVSDDHALSAEDDGAWAEGASPRAVPFAWWLAAIAVAVLGCIVTGVLAIRSDSAAVLAARWTVTVAVVGVGALTAFSALWDRPNVRGLRYGSAVVGVGMMLVSGWMGWMLVTDSWGH